MMTTKGSALSGKKDLHVGGLGVQAAAGLATMAEPWEEATDAAAPLLERARAAVRNADSIVRDNPWAAVGAVACLGLAAGYFLSRRY
jgi:ElaB/YqjD/DUF883 family membrane-anchored ribosome-binding protein